MLYEKFYFKLILISYKKICLIYKFPGRISFWNQICAWRPFALNLRYANAGVDDCLVKIRICVSDSIGSTAINPQNIARAIAFIFNKTNLWPLKWTVEINKRKTDSHYSNRYNTFSGYNSHNLFINKCYQIRLAIILVEDNTIMDNKVESK